MLYVVSSGGDVSAHVPERGTEATPSSPSWITPDEDRHQIRAKYYLAVSVPSLMRSPHSEPVMYCESTLVADISAIKT